MFIMCGILKGAGWGGGWLINAMCVGVTIPPPFFYDWYFVFFSTLTSMMHTRKE
jgi:hypothetical protein